jgi:hypothetical protein
MGQGPVEYGSNSEIQDADTWIDGQLVQIWWQSEGRGQSLSGGGIPAPTCREDPMKYNERKAMAMRAQYKTEEKNIGLVL